MSYATLEVWYGDISDPLSKFNYSFIFVFLHGKVSPMNRSASALLAAAMSLFPFLSFALDFEGPFQVRNQFPLFLSVNQPYLEQAATESSFSVGLSHSSVFVMEDAVRWSAHLDIELTQLAVRYKQDIPGLFEIGIDVPVVRATAGFMDDPLAWYHRTFGFPDYGRSTRPRNEFLYDVRRDGAPVIEGDKDRSGFGDVRMAFKKKIAGTDPLVSLMGTVELPTGNARIGYGSGSVDYGLAALLDKNIGQGSRMYANLGVVFPGDLKARQTVALDTFYYAGSGIEVLAWPEIGLLAQIMVQTSPYPRTGISQVDTTAIILAFGGRYRAGHGSYELSLTEDPNTSGAPDFVLALSFKKRI